MDLNKPVCLVIKHPKGFWMADVFLDGWAEGISSDWYCTGKKGGTKNEIIGQVHANYPGIEIEPANFEE